MVQVEAFPEQLFLDMYFSRSLLFLNKPKWNPKKKQESLQNEKPKTKQRKLTK